MTRYTWFVYGVVPVTVAGQDSATIFGGMWQQAFIEAKYDPAAAEGTFNLKCSQNGEEPGTHIYFATVLTKELLWYIGTHMATFMGTQFPVNDGDTPDEIMASPALAAFIAGLEAMGIYVTLARNDLGDNQVDVDDYLLTNHNLQIIRAEPTP